MPAEMATFCIDVELGNPACPGARAVVPNVLVDTGAELSWIPAAILESFGVERRIVFGEPGDLILLGARSLEGMNLTVDPFNKALVDAGPAPAAAGCILGDAR